VIRGVTDLSEMRGDIISDALRSLTL
jgi:hypothetical protein